MAEDHKPDRDGILKDSVSSHEADAQAMQPYETAKHAFSQHRAPNLLDRDDPHQRSFPTAISRALLTVSLLYVPLLAGCQPTMTTNSTNPSEAQDSSDTQSLGGTRMQPPPETLQVPLLFTKHSFGAYCYNTFGCRVDYDNDRQVGPAEGDDGDTYRSPPPESPDYKKEWSASYIVPRNFPPPAEVHWKSLDGVQHEAKVDIAEIFKDQLAWHKVPATDFVENSFDGMPDIFLEVNDRTINVYMEAFVPTRTEQIPGNKHSTARTDLFLVWTRTN